MDLMINSLDSGRQPVGGVGDSMKVANQAREEGQAAGADFDVLNAMPICDGGAQITTATTTTVETGPCVLGTIELLNVVASTITIYDNTAASGTIIATLPASALARTYTFNRLCSVGLTIVTAGASSLVVNTRKASA
jgi:hypothetical protein